MAENIEPISVETELTRFQHHLDLLQAMMTNINMSSEEANESINKQVDEICSHVKKLGEEIKKENEKLRREEEEKMGKLVKYSKKSVEDLKASAKSKGRKAKVEKEKLHIPVENYPWFAKGNIVNTHLSEHFGELRMGPMVTTNFDFKEDLQSGGDYGIGGLLWFVGVKKDTSEGHHRSLCIYLNWKEGSHQNTVKSCDVEFSLKLINHKDTRESVEKSKLRYTFKDAEKRYGLRGFINWNKFSNKQNGFLTEDNKFTVQATVKVLKIER